MLANGGHLDILHCLPRCKLGSGGTALAAVQPKCHLLHGPLSGADCLCSERADCHDTTRQYDALNRLNQTESRAGRIATGAVRKGSPRL